MKWVDSADRGQSQLNDRHAAFRFVHACIADSSSRVIRNAATRMKLLDTGQTLLPVSINSGSEPPDNSYVVSPLTTYSGYALDEVRRMNRPWLGWPLTRLIGPLGRRLEAAQIDRLVQVNNWLLSTNLYPVDWHGSEIQELRDFMTGEFPDHAISFRSLNRFSNAELIDRLSALGFIAIPSRQVYLFDARDGRQSKFLQRFQTT